MRARVREQRADLLQVPRPHHDLGDQPVDRRVDAAGEAVDRPGEDAVRGEDAPQPGGEVLVQGPPTVTGISWTVPPASTLTVADRLVVRRSRVRPSESVTRILLFEYSVPSLVVNRTSRPS